MHRFHVDHRGHSFRQSRGKFNLINEVQHPVMCIRIKGRDVSDFLHEASASIGLVGLVIGVDSQRLHLFAALSAEQA